MTKRERIVKSVLAHVPKDAINQFVSRGSTPTSFSVLIMAAIVGTLAGLVGTYFEIAVHFVSETRTEWLKSEIGNVLPLWLAAILISALLAFIGYYLVHRFAPEASGSGIQKLKGQWITFVQFVGGASSLLNSSAAWGP